MNQPISTHRTNEDEPEIISDDVPVSTIDSPVERRAGAGPALDWHEAKQGSGLEAPDELPDGDTHLNIDRTFVFADLSGFTQYTRENGPHEAVKLLGEFRGEPAVDRDKLIALLVGLGQLAADRSDIASIDLNPLIIADGDPVAVDALVELSEASNV